MIKRIIPAEVIWFVTAIWVIFIIDILLIGINVNQFGIRPRNTDSLPGIFLFSFLHNGLYHIASNTVPILILGSMIKASVGVRRLRSVMIFGAIGSGIGIWFLGSSGSLVVGASGMVFALLGFLLGDALFNPSFRSWVFAIIAFVIYGSILFSLLRFLPHISWAGHFWGFVSGILFAAFFKSRR